MSEPAYVGRFAPSPTGPLHFGSLVTALAGYLRARSAKGEWLVRIDDIDPPRQPPGAVDSILRALERFGLHWDRSVFYQYTHLSAHRRARDVLLAKALAYYCVCSRRTLADHPSYEGTCRGRREPPAERHSVRVQVDHTPIAIADPVQGESHWDLAAAGGDFVIWRVEDLPAYHLAAVVDDADMGVTEIVRGADLHAAAPRQRHLQVLLNRPPTVYVHLPVAVDHAGQKLSKQQRAPPLDLFPVPAMLPAALIWLGYDIPSSLHGALPGELLPWAIAHWDLARVPRRATLVAPVLAL